MNRCVAFLPLALALAACAAPPPLVHPAPIAQAPTAAPVEVQILGLNDFHGNLETPPNVISVRMADGSELKARMGGAAALAATIKRLRTANSITVSAGDLFGASPLVSAFFLDEPAVQAMNAIGLGINAVGNHEFDKGSAELKRMAAGGCQKHTSRTPCQVEPFGGASFSFLAANVFEEGGSTIFPGSTVRQFGPVRVGFIGMTLKETETLVTPAGVAGLRFADEAASANALVPALKAVGADAIVLLIHQGGRSPEIYQQATCAGLSGPILDIIDKLDPAITTIVSGHTHNAYACELDRGGVRRLLTSAGRHGWLVTDIRLKFDPATRALIGRTAINHPVRPEQGADPGVSALVARYLAAAAPAAARPVGRLRGPALYSETYKESSASNLVADAFLAATSAPASGDADLAVVNATGIRTSLVPAADGSITFGQIFAVQPFGNNLVVKTLSGAQIKAMLEQQFTVEQGVTKVATLLAPSSNVRFAYDLSKPEGQRIVSVTIDGRPLDPARRYRVTVNNFLASGGDGFSVLRQGTDQLDAGLDLDAIEAWLATNPAAPPVGRTRNLTPR